MLRVRILGELTIELDGTELEPPASRRARALLGWLALDGRTHSRSTLAARFWPDVLDESARTSLRSALSALRRSLGPDGERYVITDRDGVGLAGGDLVWTDVAEFERCIDQDRLDDAVELSRGEVLTGLDDDWVYERRDEHRDRLSDVLARLADRVEAAGDLPAAIGYTRRRIALDPLAEEPQRVLMRRLAAGGDRAGAIRAYERLTQRLRDVLRIVPSQATRELAVSLRSGGESDARPAPAPVTEEPTRTPTEAPDSGAAGSTGAVVTLLFTDLVGSTGLLDALGDDEAERFRRVHFGLLRDVAAAHAGLEVKNLGDGLMVAFPSVVDALSCAVGIQQAVQRHNAREVDDRPKVRVGLHVGEPIQDEGDYFGTPVVVAKRLCDSAEGGQILASDLVRALVGSRGSFGFTPLGPVTLKGFSEPLETCEIAWEPAVERRIPLPSPFLTDELAPMVGRDEELGELDRCWQQARGGSRRVAMLAGEPGIGKTRLATEFCRGAYADAALVLLGRCYEESLVPYQPFVEALRHYISEGPVDERRLALGAHRATLARLLPELGDGSEESFTGFGEHERFLLFDAVAALLRTLATEHDLILVLEDLHWADVPTLQMLRHVSRATEGASLLVLGTYRETEVDETHPLADTLAELRRARVLDHLELVGLGEEEVAALICSLAGLGAPPAVARSIVDRTQGNPLFVEELLRDVAVDDDFARALTGVPESVKDLLLRRLRQLDDACKQALTVGAVSGGEFELLVLERVTDTAPAELAESLEQAIAAHIVDESSASVGRYSFGHALIRESIYEQLSRTRRAQLHQRIGEAIERVYPERLDEHASELAYHFSAARDVAKAYEHHSRAAAAAHRVYAVEPALAHYTAAIDAGTELGLEADHEPALRVLLLQRARMRYRTGDVSGAAPDIRAVLDASRRCGDRATEMEALNELGATEFHTDVNRAAVCHEAAAELARELGDPGAEANALDRLAVIASHQLQFDRALEIGERALALARETGDASGLGRAIDSIKLAVWQLGDLERLKALTDELEHLWRARGELWYLQWTLLESAFVPIAQARWEEASERLAGALAINTRLRDSTAEVVIQDALCWLARSRGAYDEALSAGRRAVALAPDAAWPGWAAATLGWTLLDLGAAAAAAEVLEGGLAEGERPGAPNETVRCVSQLAWARWMLGDEDEAIALTARAMKMLGRVSAPEGGAWLFGTGAYAAVGRVLVAAGESDRAESLLVPVHRAAARSGWRDAEATTGLVLGLCFETRGELDQARETFSSVVDISGQCGLFAPGREAHAALARVLRLSGRGSEADEHVARAEEIVERMAAAVTDDSLRGQLLS